MKIEWDYTNHFINLPIQKGAEESEIRYFADDCEVAVRKLPLSRTCVDSWLCVDLSPFNAKKSYRVEVGLDNLWTRAIFAGREANLEGKDDTRAEPIIHFVPNGGNVESIREILQGKDGKWQLQYFADILGKAKDSIDCITLESPDQLDWRFSHAEYNLPKPTQQDQQELKIWQGAVRQEYFMPFSEGTLTMAVSDELGGDPPATMFSIPLVLQGQNLAPIDGIRKLRIWERHWKNVNVCKFDQKLSFRIAPGHWPNIRILEPEGKLDDISAQAFEIEIVLGCANNQRLHLDFCGFSLDITNQNIWSDGFFIPAMEKAGCLRFTVFIDQGIAEVISGGQAILVRRKNPGKKTINVDNNVSGNVGGCQIEVEPVREIHLESDSEFTIHALIVYGMRSYHYSQEAQHLIDGVEQDSPLFFKGETFAVYGNRVSDTNYGHPDAYLIDNATVVSPVRVTEEFQWRETRWGDMIRVIDRKEIWRPAFDHSGYPRFHSGINSVNATYEIAVDTFAACKSDVYALPGQSGMWAAGLFQGPGEGFGVWVRDSAHIALRCGNLLDPRGARKTLLYTTRNGFDNGPDGPAMAIVGLWDYYLVTHDRNTLMYAWPFLLGKIQQVESRFSKEIGLVKAIQSTSNDAFDEPENGGYCLSTECYFMKAYSNMALMGELLGFDRKDVGHWRFRAKQLKDSINRLYWNDTCGYYTSGPRGSQAFAEGYWETSGVESVIWSKFAIASKQRSVSVLKQLRSTAMTDFGIQLFPYRRDKNHFCGSVWTVWEAGFADAAASHQDIELIHQLIGQQVRNCIINKTFYEVIDAKKGNAWRWPSQLWHAAGFVSLLFYGLFGIRYDESGMQFQPVVPVELAGIHLEHLYYGNAILDIALEGHGTDFELILDGENCTGIPWNIRGFHQVKLRMKQGT